MTNLFPIFLGEALNLDLQDFYTEIYRLLLPMSLDPHITEAPASQDTNESDDSARPTKSALQSEAELLTKGLELMFLKKRHVGGWM